MTKKKSFEQQLNNQMNSNVKDSNNRGVSSNDDTSLLVFYWAFFRIGLFTFGGGYAMLPMLIKEVVEKYKWTTEEELLDYFAISQSTPGIIAVNTATFIGTKYRGFKGALAATLGVISPCWLIITIIAKFLDLVKGNPYVESAFVGIRIVVVALIIHSVIKMGKKAIKSLHDFLLFSTGFLFVATKLLAPIYVIIIGALIGMIIFSIKEGKNHGTV